MTRYKYNSKIPRTAHNPIITPKVTHAKMLHKSVPSPAVLMGEPDPDDVVVVFEKNSDSHLVCAVLCLVPDQPIKTADTANIPMVIKQ